MEEKVDECAYSIDEILDRIARIEEKVNELHSFGLQLSKLFEQLSKNPMIAAYARSSGIDIT